MVIEAPDGGVDTVLASVDYTMPADAEGLYMMGSGLTGMGTNNADCLLSSGGPNTLVGLDGDDLYYVNNAADVVVEVPNEGFDSVITSLSYDLSANAANVEALYLTGSGLTGTGNSDANTLVNAGANTLTGGDGNDTFVFSAGSANGATVTDFNRDQVTEWDFLVFSGFGTGAGRDLQPDRHHRPVADPFRPRCPQRDDHALEPRRGACRGFRVRVSGPRRSDHMHLALRTRTRRGARDRSAGGRTPSIDFNPSPPSLSQWEREPTEPAAKASSATLSVISPRAARSRR